MAVIGKLGPFRVNDSSSADGLPQRDASSADGRPGGEPTPLRHYGCANYTICLNLAAALNWDGFTCRGCCGQVSEALCWQARQAQRKDAVAGRICELPEIPSVDCRKGKVA